MLIQLVIENPAQFAVHIRTTRDGAPVVCILEPGEARRLVADVKHLGGNSYWYDLIFSFPDARPNLERPLVLHGPIIHWIAPYDPPASGTGVLLEPHNYTP
jgi:hypothetical protein